MATCRSASYKVEHSLEHFEQDEQRNSLSGKPQTCPRVKRFIRESPAHIGEALTDLAEGPREIQREVLVTPRRLPRTRFGVRAVSVFRQAEWTLGTLED